MAIRGIIFDNQVPNAKGFRSALRSVLSDGALSGQGPSITLPGGLMVNISNGYIIVGGGIVEIVGTESIELAQNTKAYARIKAIVDTTRTSTESTFNQFYFGVDYSDSLEGFPALFHGAIDGTNGSTWEAELCIIQKTDTSASIVSRKPLAGPKIRYGTTLPIGLDVTEGSIFLLEA